MGGPAFGRFIEGIRRLQDLAVTTDPPAELVADLADRLDAIDDELAVHVVGEGGAAGSRVDLPARGHPMLVPLVVDEWDDAGCAGRVTFRQAHVGGGQAAHGGAVALLFDEVLGRLTNTGERSAARTAYLHVNYRRVVPVDVELRVEGSVEREEGRKRWATSRILLDGEVLSDAEGLFIALRPGQP
jgi:acyl-coenzyme A thioesterase PaaI-like protein